MSSKIANALESIVIEIAIISKSFKLKANLIVVLHPGYFYVLAIATRANARPNGSA